MQFELIDASSSAGDPRKANEDRFGWTSSLAWVIDGATDLGEPGLMGRITGGAWFADAMNRALYGVDHAGTPEEIIHAAHGRVCAAYRTERRRQEHGAWELPSGALLVGQLRGNALSIAWLADCTLLVFDAGEVRRFGGGLDPLEVEIAGSAVSADGARTDAPPAGALLARLRGQREAPDRPALSVDPQSIAQLHSASVPYSVGAELILMTDGFSALLDHHGVSGLELRSLSITARLSGMNDLLRRCEGQEPQEIAARRVKRSDDASALHVRIATARCLAPVIGGADLR